MKVTKAPKRPDKIKMKTQKTPDAKGGEAMLAESLQFARTHMLR